MRTITKLLNIRHAFNVKNSKITFSFNDFHKAMKFLIITIVLIGSIMHGYGMPVEGDANESMQNEEPSESIENPGDQQSVFKKNFKHKKLDFLR